MKFALTLPTLILLTSLPMLASPVHEEKDGVVMIEAESVTSRLGEWEPMTEIEGYSGGGYLQFMGNKPTSGKPNSKLEYVFKITKGGLYYLALRCAREKVGNRDDLANDCYVALKGDFGPGPNSGDKNGNDAPGEMLKENTKFFGGNDKQFVWAHGGRLDPGGHNNKRVAIYELRTGEEYTLVVHGRSKLFKLDQIAFVHEDKVGDILKKKKGNKNKDRKKDKKKQ